MAHHGAILAQLLKLAPRHEFEALAGRFHRGRRLRSRSGFIIWESGGWRGRRWRG